MKYIIFFISMLFSGEAITQNTYLFDVTDNQDGSFTFILWDATSGTQGMSGQRWTLDSLDFKQLIYQRVENLLSTQASREASAFLFDLQAEQIQDSLGQYVALDYQTAWADDFSGLYDGVWTYEVRDGGNTQEVTITGTDIILNSNSSVIATITPETPTSFFVTFQGNTWKMVRLRGSWVGRNHNDKIVTLTN